MAYDEAIAAADEAYDRQQWTQAQQLYDDALAVKPGDRYAKSRKERAQRAATLKRRPRRTRRGPVEADLDRERAAMEREAQREAERQNEAAEALELNCWPTSRPNATGGSQASGTSRSGPPTR